MAYGACHSPTIASPVSKPTRWSREKSSRLRPVIKQKMATAPTKYKGACGPFVSVAKAARPYPQHHARRAETPAFRHHFQVSKEPARNNVNNESVSPRRPSSSTCPKLTRDKAQKKAPKRERKLRP